MRNGRACQLCHAGRRKPGFLETNLLVYAMFVGQESGANAFYGLLYLAYTQANVYCLQRRHSMSDTAIQEQQLAPDFTLPAVGDESVVRDGQVHLDDLKGKMLSCTFIQRTVEHL